MRLAAVGQASQAPSATSQLRVRAQNPAQAHTAALLATRRVLRTLGRAGREEGRVRCIRGKQPRSAPACGRVVLAIALLTACACRRPLSYDFSAQSLAQAFAPSPAAPPTFHTSKRNIFVEQQAALTSLDRHLYRQSLQSAAKLRPRTAYN